MVNHFTQDLVQDVENIPCEHLFIFPYFPNNHLMLSLRILTIHNK